MKQVFKYASLLFVAGALLVTSCSKKKDDAVTPEEPTPTTTPSGAEVCLSNNTTYLLIDASTDATQNSYAGQNLFMCCKYREKLTPYF